MASSCLNPESKLGQKQFMTDIPSVDLLRSFLCYSITFCSSKFCSYSFKIIHFHAPSQSKLDDTDKRRCGAPVASVRPWACARQPGSLGSLGLLAYFQLKPSLLCTQPSRNPSVPGVRRARTRVSLAVIRMPELSALLSCG